MDFAKNALKNKVSCHDCKKEIEIQNKEIKNGVLLGYQDGSEKFTIFKCNDCFKNNPGLTNYKQCEVYSRVVGYLRPVQQWNDGKRHEFSSRKEYNLRIK